MNKRSKVISAGALLVVGGFLTIVSLLGGSDLQATTVGATSFNWSGILIVAGIAALIISAFLFISAGAE